MGAFANYMATKKVEQALQDASRQLEIGEAQIAKGLGFSLCQCSFPPTPMLTVGRAGQRETKGHASPEMIKS